MSSPRADLVVIGQVVVAARPGHLERADAVGIAGERVVRAGEASDVLAVAKPGARIVDVRDVAVVPGLNDFHLHLVGLSRARRSIRLDGAAGFDEVVVRVGRAAAALPADAWLTGRGWTEATLDSERLGELVAAVGARRALLVSHDGHSAWASPAALVASGIGDGTPDPSGGRIERRVDGTSSGVLRERAMDAVTAIVEPLRGPQLTDAVDETLAELASFGITAATDAGDATTDNGSGPFAELGDSFSALAGYAPLLDGRLRLTINLPAAGIRAAGAARLRSGQALTGAGPLRVGWAKVYTDGALGSGTAALFEPDSCGGDRGILRVDPDELTELLRAGQAAGISLAMHAIGDRACATVLEAVHRAGSHHPHVPAHRIEHAQLMRPGDRSRLAGLGVTASLQPIHAAADRERAEACWAGRIANAYAWRSLADAGALLAFGSDAPVESVDPWLGIFAAVHRRLPTEVTPDWTPDEALDPIAALSAYTLGPALAMGSGDEGHLRPGALADLAVLDVDLATLLAGGDRLASVRSQLTMVGGREVHRS